MEKREIGVSTNCECGETLAETLSVIRNAGFRNVMLSEKDSELSLEQSIKLVKDMGLNIAFLHLTYDKTSNDLWTCENENSLVVKRLCDSIEIMSKHNIKIAVMHPSNYNIFITQPLTERSDEIGIKNMKKVVNVAEKFGVKIAVENLNNDIENNDLEILLDNIKSDYLGFCYDLGHHINFNPQYDFLSKYKDRVLAIHIHDNDMNFEEIKKTGCHPDSHLLPFDGKGDLENIVKQIAKTNYDDVVMLELHRTDFTTKPPYKVHKRYEHITPLEYLKEAYVRGEKLLKMFEEAKK